MRIYSKGISMEGADGAERDVYAGFPGEAAILLEKKSLKGAARRFRVSRNKWTAFVEIAEAEKHAVGILQARMDEERKNPLMSLHSFLWFVFGILPHAGRGNKGLGMK